MRRFFAALFILVFASLLAGGWYVYHRGFTRKWRTYVSDEFRARGVELSIRQLTLDPFRGVLAKGVKVYEAEERKSTLGVIDEMRLVINWANLIRGKTFLDALDLRDATVALPLDPADLRGPKIEVKRMSGRLFLPPEQIYLSSFEAELYGIRINASGRIVNPQAARSTPRTAPSNASTQAILRAIQELKALRYKADSPMLELRFSGDLARPETVFVEAKLWAEKIQRGPLNVETLYLDALYRDQRVAIRQIAASDQRGVLRVSGSYDLQAHTAELQLRSNIDPQPAVRAFARVAELDEFVFYGAPKIDLTASATFGETLSLHVAGHLDAGRFGYKSVVFDQGTLDGVWDGERWAARNVKLVHQSGEITGDVMQLPGDFRTRLKSTINPKALAPFLQGRAAEWFKQFDFLDSPDLSLEVAGPKPDAESLAGNAAVRLGRTSYRDIWAQAVTATLRYGDRKLSVDPMRVIRTEGSADGGLQFDFVKNEVKVEKIHTSLHPQEIIWWIDPKLLHDLAPYRFGKRPPNLLMDGLVHTKGGDTTQLRVDVDAPGGMDYTFLRRELHASQISARLDFTSARMKITNLNASVLGGKLRGSGDISLKKADPNHSADVRLENMDFAALTKLYFNYDDSKGRLNARYGFSIKGADARSMRGRGDLAVTDGKVFAFPFLGPLSYILNGIVPGMGNDVARKGAASLSISDGVLTTDDFLVEATGFEMFGAGKLFFLDDKMNFDVRINARGLPGVLLFPVSKLFEYTATDTLAKPNWRPKLVPRL